MINILNNNFLKLAFSSIKLASLIHAWAEDLAMMVAHGARAACRGIYRTTEANRVDLAVLIMDAAVILLDAPGLNAKKMMALTGSTFFHKTTSLWLLL